MPEYMASNGRVFAYDPFGREVGVPVNDRAERAARYREAWRPPNRNVRMLNGGCPCDICTKEVQYHQYQETENFWATTTTAGITYLYDNAQRTNSTADVWTTWTTTTATTWTTDASWGTVYPEIIVNSGLVPARQYVPPPPPTPEERERLADAAEADALRRRQETERWREQFRAAKEREEKATETARALLEEILTPEQRQEVRLYNHFTVIGETTRRRYQIKVNQGRHGNITEVDEEGQRINAYCAAPGGALPEPDAILAQKLMIEHAEEEFLATANRTPLRRAA